MTKHNRLKILQWTAVLLLLVLTTSCHPNFESQEVEPATLNSLMNSNPSTKTGTIERSGVEACEYDIRPCDTLMLYYYEGHLSQLSKLKKGVWHGVLLEFWPNGNLYMTGHSNNGKSDGIFRKYDENGKLKSITGVVNGHSICEGIEL